MARWGEDRLESFLHFELFSILTDIYFFVKDPKLFLSQKTKTKEGQASTIASFFEHKITQNKSCFCFCCNIKACSWCHHFNESRPFISHLNPKTQKNISSSCSAIFLLSRHFSKTISFVLTLPPVVKTIKNPISKTNKTCIHPFLSS